MKSGVTQSLAIKEKYKVICKIVCCDSASGLT